MKRLELDDLKLEAKLFCEFMCKENHRVLIGVTDGKAVGTYVEHRFREYLNSKYEVAIGGSAKGIDLPGENIQTDIKVTSVVQPQSSCPFQNTRQKIFGLGYNILVFVYEKQDTAESCALSLSTVRLLIVQEPLISQSLSGSGRWSMMAQTKRTSLVFLQIKMFREMILFTTNWQRKS